MKISASIYSNKAKPIDEVIKELDRFQIDFLHIDCNDDPAVFDDIAYIRKISPTPIDIHLITSDPEKYFEPLIKHGVELVTYQHENLSKRLKYPPEIQARLGIAFTGDTPVEVFEEYRDQCSFILFMTTTPGQSGGSFDKATFERIRNFKTRYPSKRVHVDGGVNHEVSFILRNLGVYCAVSGSFLVSAQDISTALINLKSDIDHTHYHINDFMLMPNELPILRSEEAVSMRAVLLAINDSKMGFTLLVDGDGRLEGVVTDGDVRRAFLRHIDNLNEVTLEDLINRNPISIGSDATISQMAEIIKNHTNPIVFLPVVDPDSRLVGTISFNNLVKGDL